MCQQCKNVQDPHPKVGPRAQQEKVVARALSRSQILNAKQLELEWSKYFDFELSSDSLSPLLWVLSLLHE